MYTGLMYLQNICTTNFSSSSSNVFFSIIACTQDKKQIVHFAAELGYVQILSEVLRAGHNGRAVMEVCTYIHNICRECIFTMNTC